ncbi:MAG TPA: holo-ACP synthase [Planctomycetota bacterium]|nr:holo-ACP synthase [Planctomycetota bacterium]
MIIGIGVDIVEPERIAGMIERHGERFLERTFTSGEIAYCGDRKRAVEHFAARWAAKEAVAKALGTGISRRVHWKDIEVVKKGTGAASIKLHGGAQAAARKLGVNHIHLSLSHIESLAVAMVIIEG